MKQSLHGQRNSRDIQKMETLADDGDSEYMWHLARCFEHGIGVESDLKKAYNYYMKASLFGNIKARYRTIFMIENGIGVEKDVEKAGQLVKILTGESRSSKDIYFAADLNLNCNLNNLVILQPNLSHPTLSLRSIPRLHYIGAYISYAKAIDIKSLLIKHKENAEEDSKFRTIDPDWDDLAKTHALRLGSYDEFLIENKTNAYPDPPSQGGMPKTPLVNFFNFLIRDNVSLCRPMALVGLAQCYEFGVGVEKKSSTAFAYYKQAADLGDIASCFRVAKELREGVNVEKNIKESFRYYKLAADGGNKEAAKMVANLYIIGDGTEKNSDAAARYSILGLGE